MFKLPTKDTPILYQGITTEMGAVHTERAIAYGSHIVAGTSRDPHVKNYQNIPVFQTVREAVRKTKPVVSVIFSTPARALTEVEEAVRAKIPLIICTTEHVPLHDCIKMILLARQKGVTLIGPSSPGIVRVGECLSGCIPAHLFPKGNVGIIGRSSSLMYEAVQQLSAEGLGVSTCISLGASHLIATPFTAVLDEMMADKQTKAILVVGQLSGNLEMDLALAYRKYRRKKPLIVYIPGQTESGAKVPLLEFQEVNFQKVISEQKEALQKAGAVWISNPAEMGKTVVNTMQKK